MEAPDGEGEAAENSGAAPQPRRAEKTAPPEQSPASSPQAPPSAPTPFQVLTASVPESTPLSPAARLLSGLWRLGRLLLLAYAILCALAYFGQDALIFPAPPPLSATPAALGLNYQHLRLNSRRGTPLSAWWVPAAPGAPLRASVLYFYGNAESKSHHLDTIARLHRLGAAVLICDYPGYGASGGKASESSLMDTADAAYAYLVRELHIRPSRILLYGRSLGGAVAVDLASRQCVPHKPHGGLGGLVLEATFTSLDDLAGGMYPFLPRALLRHHFDSRAKIASCAGLRVLFLHGDQDRLVPWRMSQELLAQLQEAIALRRQTESLYLPLPPPRLVLVPGAGYNDLWEIGQNIALPPLRQLLEEIGEKNR